MAIINGNSTNEQIERLQRTLQDTQDAKDFLQEYGIDEDDLTLPLTPATQNRVTISNTHFQKSVAFFSPGEYNMSESNVIFTFKKSAHTIKQEV